MKTTVERLNTRDVNGIVKEVTYLRKICYSDKFETAMAESTTKQSARQPLVVRYDASARNYNGTDFTGNI